MNWIANVLPLINATGVPLLGVGVIVLVLAYQRSSATYRQAAKELTRENDRLRTHLTETDNAYLDEARKMRSIVSRSVRAMEQLQIRKLALLSDPESASNVDILADVQKINEAIRLMQELSGSQRKFELQQMQFSSYMEDRIQQITVQIGEVAQQIGDIKTRVVIAPILAPTSEQDLIKSAIEHQGRGIVATPDPLAGWSPGMQWHPGTNWSGLGDITAPSMTLPPPMPKEATPSAASPSAGAKSGDIRLGTSVSNPPTYPPHSTSQDTRN